MKNKKTSAAIATQLEAPVVVLPTPVAAAQPVLPAPVFKVANADFKPAKGFASVLFAEVAKQPGTAAALLARLLASGEYQKVAPKAAEHRAAKPINFLLKTWVASGALLAA